MSTKYRADLDGLRALAVGGVVVYHAFPAALPSGYVGVDIFFVISGFLVTSLLLDDASKSRFSILNFYARRANRILPALIFVLVTSLIAGWFLLFPDEYKSMARQTASAAVSAANIYFFRVSGYFDTDSATKPLLHLWSLGVEEQFYFVWPFVLLVFTRFWKVGWVVLAAVIVGSFAANIYMGSENRAAEFYLPFFRVWELAAGGVLAMPAQWARKLSSTMIGIVAGWIGLLLLIVSMFIIPPFIAYPGWWGLLPVAGTCLVISANPVAGANRIILSNPAMVAIGLVSYPFYLWHWPLLSFDTIVQGSAPSPLRAAVLVAMALALSVATYLGLERPLRSRRGSRRLAVFVIACVICVGAVGWVVSSMNGVPQRSIMSDYAFNNGQFEDVATYNCALKPEESKLLDLCRAPEGSGEPHIVMYGDSHAWRLYLVLRKAIPHGTISFYGHTGGALAIADVPDLIAAGEGPDYVNVVSYQPENLSANKLMPRLERALAAGHRLVLVLDNPRLPQHPRECLGRPLRGVDAIRSCESTRQEQERYLAEQSQLFELIRSQYPQQVSVVRTVGLFCNEDTCGYRDTKSGEVLYDDSHHLSRFGSGKVADMLLPYLFNR